MAAIRAFLKSGEKARPKAIDDKAKRRKRMKRREEGVRCRMTEISNVMIVASRMQLALLMIRALR